MKNIIRVVTFKSKLKKNLTNSRTCLRRIKRKTSPKNLRETPMPFCKMFDLILRIATYAMLSTLTRTPRGLFSSSQLCFSPISQIHGYTRSVNQEKGHLVPKLLSFAWIQYSVLMLLFWLELNFQKNGERPLIWLNQRRIEWSLT